MTNLTDLKSWLTRGGTSWLHAIVIVKLLIVIALLLVAGDPDENPVAVIYGAF